METLSCKKMFPNCKYEQTQLKTLSYRRCGKNGAGGGGNVFVFFVFFHAAQRSFFTLSIVNPLTNNELMRRYAFDLDTESSHGQPASRRTRPVNADHGLEDTMWIRGLGG